MTGFFISYRRSDSAGYAGRLAGSLESAVGADRVFHDIEDIKPGDDFVEDIERNLKHSDVFLPVIGKGWFDARDGSNQRRLDDPDDYVRLEIETALRLGARVIPVLVGGAVMPDAESLPASMTALTRRQAIEISDSRWDQDVERLLQAAGHTAPLKKGALSFRGRVPAAGASRRSAVTALALSAVALILLTSAWFYLKAPNLSGKWYFERGDYLLIRQDGGHFTIERTDPALQTTYEKGAGTFKGRRLEFELDPIYSQQYRLRGELEVSWDGRRMTGRLEDMLSDESREVALSRNKPANDK